MSTRAVEYRRPIRLAAWAGFGVLVVLAAAVRLAGLAPTITAGISDAITYLLPIALVVVAGGVLSLRLLPGLEHRFWGLIVGASALLLVSESWWTLYAVMVDPRGPQVPWAGQILHFASAALFFGVILTMTEYVNDPPAMRARFYFDLVGALVVLYPFVYLYGALPALDGIAGVPLPSAPAVLAVYPVLGAMMIGSSLAVVVGWKAHEWRSWERLVTAAVALFGTGLVLQMAWYPAMYASSYSGSSWYSVVLGFGYYVLFMAVVYRATSADAQPMTRPWPAPRVVPTWFARIYPVLLAVALPVIGAIAFGMSDTPLGLPVLFAAVVLAILLVIRSWLASLERVQHRLQSIADPVTGVFNRRYFSETADDIVDGCADARVPLYLAIFDVEDFRRVNALLGHQQGDALLKAIAGIIAEEAPRHARVYRLGSDELVILAPGEDVGQAVDVARRVVLRVRRQLSAGRVVPIEVSAGIAGFPDHGVDASALLAAASRARERARGGDNEPIFVSDGSVTSADADTVRRAKMRTLRATVRALAEAVDARDSATKNHSSNVADLATALAQMVGLDEPRVQLVGLAALVHDVGKIGVPDSVLLKPAPLNAEERTLVECHTLLGERILAPARLDDILPLVRSHHERWDGTGYPDGLSGEQIPLEARILAICDAFETMTTGRPYRAAVSIDEALDEIERGAHTQFDAALATSFARMVRSLRPAIRTEAVVLNGRG